jgi:isoprenylcysteine carboxyl methyltransferase (ICMT) family protein YpbQ
MLSNTFEVYTNSIFKFGVDNYKQIFLLILAFLIICMVEYITHLNSIIYGITQIPGLNVLPSTEHVKKHINKRKGKRKK